MTELARTLGTGGFLLLWMILLLGAGSIIHSIATAWRDVRVAKHTGIPPQARLIQTEETTEDG